jgi:hypothetical protein
MLERITIALGSGRDEILRSVFMGDFESMKSAERAHFESGDAMSAVINGAGGAGEVEDVVHSAHVEGFANIFLYKLETGLIFEVSEISAAAGEEVVDDHDVPAFSEKSVAKMGA